MSPDVSQLADYLRRETDLVRELSAILQADQRHIVSQDVDALERSNRVKEERVLVFQSLEAERRELAGRLARRLGLDPDEARVSRMAPLLGEDGSELEATAETLRAALGALAELLAVSRGFLEQSILGVRGLLALIHSLRAPQPGTYDASGRHTAGEAAGLAVRREA